MWWQVSVFHCTGRHVCRKMFRAWTLVYPCFSISVSLFIDQTVGSSSVFFFFFSSLNKPTAPSGHQKCSLSISSGIVATYWILSFTRLYIFFIRETSHISRPVIRIRGAPLKCSILKSVKTIIARCCRVEDHLWLWKRDLYEICFFFKRTGSRTFWSNFPPYAKNETWPDTTGFYIYFTMCLSSQCSQKKIPSISDTLGETPK